MSFALHALDAVVLAGGVVALLDVAAWVVVVAAAVVAVVASCRPHVLHICGQLFAIAGTVNSLSNAVCPAAGS